MSTTTTATAMDNLMLLLKSVHDVDCIDVPNIIIDDVEGILRIVVPSEKDPFYRVRFYVGPQFNHIYQIPDISDYELVDKIWSTADVSKVPELLARCLNQRLVGMKWHHRDAPESREVILRKAVYELQGKEMEECCVCHGPTYGYKTACGKHDICSKCFHNTWKNSTNRKVFKCPICREETMEDEEDED